MKTERRVIPGTDGLAEADAEGRLYVRGHLATPRLRPTGYLEQWLPVLGKVSAHVAVCLAWHGAAPFDGAHVDHIDRDRTNNVPSNLVWALPAHNYGRRILKRGPAHPNATLSAREVRIARSLHADGVPCPAIARALGVSRSTAWRAATSRTYDVVRETA